MKGGVDTWHGRPPSGGFLSLSLSQELFVTVFVWTEFFLVGLTSVGILRCFNHHKSFLPTAFHSRLPSWQRRDISWKVFGCIRFFLTESQEDTLGPILNHRRQILFLNRNKMNEWEKNMNNTHFRINKDLLLTRVAYFAGRPQVTGYG